MLIEIMPRYFVHYTTLLTHLAQQSRVLYSEDDEFYPRPAKCRVLSYGEESADQGIDEELMALINKTNNLYEKGIFN
jgi:hypothetical protein